MHIDMKKTSLLCALAFAASACGAFQNDTKTELLRLATTQEEIQGGTVNQTALNVVGILMNMNGGLGICSGSLIGPNLVLSAHHCVAQMGSVAQCSNNSFGSTYPTSAFLVTTKYDAIATVMRTGRMPRVDNSTWFAVSKVWVPGGNVCGQDMSLLELSSAIPNVCPLVPRVDAVVQQSEAYTAIGFGITSPTGQSSSGTRYSVGGLKVLCKGNCATGSLDIQEWIGGTNEQKGTCEGDSGGPAIDTLGRVIGTVSRGPQYQCNQTVYESVYALASFIKQYAQQAATDGQYTPAGWVTGASTSDPASGYCPNAVGSTGGAVATGGTVATGGATATGGVTSTMQCRQAGLTCVSAAATGQFACVDYNSQTGVPANAPNCSLTMACPTNYDCYATSNTSSNGKCLERCVSSTGTGGAPSKGGQVASGGRPSSTGGISSVGGVFSTGGISSAGGNDSGAGGTSSAEGGSDSSAQGGGTVEVPLVRSTQTTSSCSSAIYIPGLWGLVFIALFRRRA